jgi:formylglycine-generating enzyme required for sulfatase activity
MGRARSAAVVSAVVALAVAACGGPQPSASDVAESTIPPCTTVAERWVSPDDGATLVCVPAGPFLMGDDPEDPDADPAATPRHEVHLSAYWIDRTEVTNAAYETCVERGACPPRPAAPGTTGVASKTRSDYYHDPAYADYPVLIYTAEEAIAYCDCMGRRLPTEAEWERAAGDQDGRTYPWGDTLDCDHAVFYGCADDTVAVAALEAGESRVGALGMAGNVAEWVADLWAEGYDVASPVVDPTGPASGSWHVRRGGGFSSLRRDLTVTARRSGAPSHYFDGQMGFRCAVSAAPDAS